MRLLITGANGVCGSALLNLEHDVTFVDSMPPDKIFSDKKFIQTDLTDLSLLEEIVNGQDAVIHMAASSAVDSKWEDVLKNNIIATKNLFDISTKMGVGRVIFGSSNHTVGNYEISNIPDIYEVNTVKRIDVNYPVWPDSYYGISKVFAENLGRLYADTRGLRFYSLRIGAILNESENTPYAYAERGVSNNEWKRDDSEYTEKLKRLKAIWLSRRDFCQLISRCLDHNGALYNVFFATSDNVRSWMDISDAKKILGYKPKDASENWIELPEQYNSK